MKIYLTSSSRNVKQPTVLTALRKEGHEVYDFKENPSASAVWEQIDPRHASTRSAEWLRDMLVHPIAKAGFKCNYDAMKWADVCVLLLPCGTSPHLEAGWFTGVGKPVAVLAPEIHKPKLMYKLFDTRDAWGECGKHTLPLGEWQTPLFDNFADLADHLQQMTKGR